MGLDRSRNLILLIVGMERENFFFQIVLVKKEGNFVLNLLLIRIILIV